MISKREKKRKQHEKELNSMRNKMGNNTVWFNSLSKSKQYDILFLWKREKHRNKKTKPEIIIVSTKVPIDSSRPWGKKKIVKKRFLKYPASLKHFIKECKLRIHPHTSRVRDTAIDLILKRKNKK